MQQQSQQPHVVYILTKLELGGAQKVCLALMNGLEQHHIKASLISGAQGVLVPETQKFDSVYLLKSFKREVGIKSIFLEIKNFFYLLRLLKRLKKQHGTLIVHTHSTKAGIVGRWTAFFAGIRHRIHTVHGYGFHDFQSRPAWLIIYLSELLTSLITTHFVCVSEKDHATGIKLFPGFAGKSSLIRAAVDEQKFLSIQRTRKASTFILGTISCLKPQKNIFDLLKAFSVVYRFFESQNHPTPPLQIIGDGIMRQDIEAWLKTEDLEQAVDLLGWQSDVACWLEQWDLFIMSSLWEGLPCAVVEARLSNIPVIAYNVGGLQEVILDNKNGFLIPPGKWELLAEKIITVIKNPDLYRRLKEHQDHLGDFYTSSMIQQHLNLYNKLSLKNRQL